MVFLGRHLSRSLAYHLKQPSWNRLFLKPRTNLHHVSVYLGQPRILSHKSDAYDDLSSKYRMKTNCMINQAIDQSEPQKFYYHHRIYKASQLKDRVFRRNIDQICLNQQRSFCKEADKDSCYCKKLEDENCALQPLPKPEPKKKCSRISRKRKHLLEQKKKAAKSEAPPESQSEPTKPSTS
uniref:MIP36644p1 n=1 Tax=Drosophila melanogaster TaxID=7227 RepID=N0BRY4_DROME|nr:MIP36644p1 [Drosophila melanogaster]